MKLLLDTHALLWWLDDPRLLSPTARQAIAEPRNDILVSAAVCWEIAIKRALGKLAAPADLRVVLRSCGFMELDITPAHALATERLTLHHRDPFDRMLVAQALMEGSHTGLPRSRCNSLWPADHYRVTTALSSREPSCISGVLRAFGASDNMEQRSRFHFSLGDLS